MENHCKIHSRKLVGKLDGANKKHSGPLQIAPEKLGNSDYKELEKSPGTYVKVRLKC